MVGGVAVLLVVLAYVGVRHVLGGDAQAQGPTPPDSALTAEPTTTTTTPVVTSPRHNDLSVPPEFPLRDPPVRAVSAADPLTVWTIGDSTAQALGELLASKLADRPEVRTRTIHKNSTGLTRSDFYDWPAALPGILAEGAPDVVVVSLGDNDAQPLVPQGATGYVEVGDPAWTAEYTRRLRTLVEQLTAAGSRVYLVGQPTMRDPAFDARIRVVDDAYRAVAAADPRLTYVDSRALLGDDGAAYTDELPGPGGATVTVRSADGIHLSLEGARWMATVVGRQVLADYGLPPR